MMDSLSNLTEYLDVLCMAASVIAGYVLWQANQRFVSKKRFEVLNTENKRWHEKQDQMLDELTAQLVKIDTTIKNLPNYAALHKMELNMEELRGYQKEIQAQLKSQNTLIEHLMSSIIDRKVYNSGTKKHS